MPSCFPRFASLPAQRTAQPFSDLPRSTAAPGRGRRLAQPRAAALHLAMESMPAGDVRLVNGGVSRRRARGHVAGGQSAKRCLVDDRQPLRPLTPDSAAACAVSSLGAEDSDDRHRHLPPADPHPGAPDHPEPASGRADRLCRLLQRFSVGDPFGQRHSQGDGVGVGFAGVFGALVQRQGRGRAGQSNTSQARMAQVSYRRRLAQRTDLPVATGGSRTSHLFLPAEQPLHASAHSGAGRRRQRGLSRQSPLRPEGRTRRRRRTTVLPLDDARRDGRTRQFA